ncbi:MAG TPA: hypothetical protein VHW02_05235 [Rhizomicrobium sp.]|jgi:hypothetical protein|nr:hypothetical protein [Rhizomicrobium sp.]
MMLLKSATFAAAIVAVTAIGIGAASAASSDDCIRAAEQANTAIKANQESPQISTARRAASDAQSFCASGMYDRGVARYAEVAKDLGQ